MGLRRLLAARGVEAESSDRLIRGLESADLDSAGLEPVDRAMLDYARKLTIAPGTVCREDVESLRAVGFDDRAIHDVCAITAYFAFVNRIADGLGVELEST